MNKAALRRLLQARRERLPAEQRAAWSRSAQAHLISTPLWQSARSVALYHPFPSEVSTALLMAAAWADGKRVALPITPPMGQPLRFVQVLADTPLVPGPFGTREPPPRCPDLEDLALVVMPGLAWDQRGGRLGYGGGYYDRSFASGPKAAAKRIQLAFEAQEQPRLPMERHDLRTHGVATERGLRFRY